MKTTVIQSKESLLKINLINLFLEVLGVELRASCMLGR
jgi:hypothetical protein